MNTLQHSARYENIVAINVDIQNDFALPTGSLSVPDGEAIIPAVNKVNEYVRAQRGDVIYTQDWHRPDNEKHFTTWPVHCVQNKAGAALHDELDVQAYDTVAHKGMYLEDDGYSGWDAELVAGQLTALVERLPKAERTVGRAIGILAAYAAEQSRRTAVIVQGLATDYCDKATVLDVLADTDRENTDVFVVIDAVRAVDVKPGDGDAAIAEMLAAGAHPITSQEIIDGSVVIDRTRLEK